MANNKKQPNYNMHEYMNKHRKKVLTFISLTVVLSMIVSLIGSIMAFM